MISFCAAASCCSSYCSMSLLISSEPASSSEGAGSSVEAASGLAGSTDAPSPCATGEEVASLVASLTCVAVSVLPGSTVFGTSLELSPELPEDSEFCAVAAAAAVGLSWSENMVDGLRGIFPCLSKVFLANDPLG